MAAWNNTTTMAGRIVNDPVMRYLPSGKAVLNFRIATSRKVGDDYVSSFWEVAAWEKTAEGAVDILEKGLKVIVMGSTYIEEYEMKEGGTGKAAKMTADLIGVDTSGVDSVVKKATAGQRAEPVPQEAAW